MPFFKVKFVDGKGKQKTRTIEVIDESFLKQEITKKYGTLVSYEEIKKYDGYFSLQPRVKPIEVIIFLRQFSVMVHSGATILESLKSLKSQKHSRGFSYILSKIYNDVISGVHLSDAFMKHPNVFPKYFCNMIKIGEVTGSLENVLLNLATYYENDRKIKSKARNALIYPMFLCIMVVIVVFFMALFVIPQFEVMFVDMKGEMPLITRIVLAVSKFMRNNIFFIFSGLIIFCLFIYIFFKSDTGKKFKAHMAITLPIIGKIQYELTTARFAKAFVILLESGMTMVDCLTNLKIMLENESVKKKFDTVISNVKRGVMISQALRSTHFFPDMLVDMIAVGERTGNLEMVLKSCEGYFDEKVESAITKSITVLEPILIVFLGLMIGIIILAIFIPIITMMQQI